MNILIIYLILVLVAFVLYSGYYLYEENYLKEAFIASLLNIVGIIVIAIYYGIRWLAIKRGTKILGHRPKMTSDFIALGQDGKSNIYSWKNLLIILFTKRVTK